MRPVMTLPFVDKGLLIAIKTGSFQAIPLYVSRHFEIIIIII
jgi:hypothetical protein